MFNITSRINPKYVLELIRLQIDCQNLYLMVEDDTNLVLDLDDSYVYFIIEATNSNYRLTTHSFLSTLQKQSETRLSFKTVGEVANHIMNFTINKTKIRCIPCKRK